MKSTMVLARAAAALLCAGTAFGEIVEANHFDSPEDLLKWNARWTPEQAKAFFSSEGAEGKGCLNVGGIGRTFRTPLENGVVSFLMYNRNTESFSANPPATVQIACVREGAQKPSTFDFIFRGACGWSLRHRDRGEDVPYVHAANHTGWTKFDFVAVNRRISLYIDGIRVTTLEPEYTAIRSFYASQTPSPTRYDEYSLDTDPATFRPNPVSRILQYESKVVKAGEKLDVAIPLDARGLRPNGVLELRLLTKQGKLVSSARNAKDGRFTLPAVPRSGCYFLETRYHVPGKHADICRQNVNIQVVDPKWNDSGLAPLPLHKTPWTFLPAGDPAKKGTYFDIPTPAGEDLREPEHVPASWDAASSIIGPWHTSSYGNCGRGYPAAWYRQVVQIPSAWSGRNVTLTVEDPMTEVVVFANGAKCGKIEWPRGSVTLPTARAGQPLDLALYVIANPDYGYYKIADGILREDNAAKRTMKVRGLCGKVTLSPEPAQARISFVAISPAVAKRTLTLNFDLAGLVPGETYNLSGAVLDAGREVLAYGVPAFTAARATERKTVTVNWNDDVRLWEISRPYLYDLTAKLTKKGLFAGRADAMWPVRFGFRDVSARGPRLLVNNRPVTLFLTLYHPGDSIDFYRMCETIHAFSPYAEFDPDFYDETGMTSLRTGYDIMRGYAYAIPALVKKNLVNTPEFWERSEAMTRAIIDARRNHASVLSFFGVCAGNTGGQGSKYNPFFANGSWVNRLEGNALGIEINRNYARALATMRRLAPDQLIHAQDSGSFNDTRAITEYAGFLPIQEIIEEGLWWEKVARKPLLITEQAAPFYANWTDGCSQAKGWAGIPCYQEWMAITEGDAAWARDDYYTNQLARLERDVFRRHADLEKRVRNATELRKAKMRERLKVGVPEIQADLDFTAHAKVTRDRMRENIFFLRAFGIGSMSFGFTSEIDKIRAWREYQRPVTGFLAGRRELITDKTHIYRPGETLRRGVVLLNNGCDPATLSAAWELVLDGERIASGHGERRIPAGGKEFLPIDVALPGEAKDRRGTLTVKIIEDGTEIRADVCEIDVLAPVKYAGTKPVALVDLERETVDAFIELGIPYHLKMFDEDFTDYDVIVFGRRAFNYENRLLSEGLDLRRLLDAGKKIVILEQDEAILRDRFKFRTEYVSPRDMFGRIGDHPLLKGLPDRVLKYWRGAATLTTGYEVAANRGKIRSGDFNDGGTWNYIWNDGKPHNRPMKWGNTHNVSTVTVIKPDTGNFRPLVDCAYGANYLAAFEFLGGRGRIIFSQVDVIARTESDPAANRYLVNLLNYATALPAGNDWRKVVCVPDGRADKLLASLNIPFAARPEGIAAEKMIYVVSGKSEEAAALARKGATVFVLPGSDYSWLPVPVTTAERTLNQTLVGKPAAPLLAGLGNADFFWKGNVKINAVRGAKLTDTGVLEQLAHGKGRFVLCQIEPEMFGDIEIRHWLKASRQITERMIRTLFTNLGAEMRNPKLVYPPYATTMLDGEFDFAGEWEVARSAAEQPPADGWRKLAVPGDPQAAYPEWKSKRGGFWYRRTVDLPDVSAAERLKLFIGCISGSSHLYVNGKPAAVTDMQTDPNTVASMARDYEIDKTLFKAGQNVIAIRVQYDADAALGLRGSTGAIQPPFKLSVFRPVVQSDIPEAMKLNSEWEWWGQPIASATGRWNHQIRKRVPVPGIIQSNKQWGDHTGYFRYWYEFKMEKPLPAGVKPFLEIAAVDDEDTTFFNRKQIGHTGRDTNPHDYWKARRIYPIPPELFKVGNNHIEMIHNDFNASGGITGDVVLHFEDPAVTQRRKLAERPYLHNVGRADDPYWHHGF